MFFFQNWTFPPKKRTNEFYFTTMKPQVNLFSFILWRKLKTPKRHSEINWPLDGCSFQGEGGNYIFHPFSLSYVYAFTALQCEISLTVFDSNKQNSSRNVSHLQNITHFTLHMFYKYTSTILSLTLRKVIQRKRF